MAPCHIDGCVRAQPYSQLIRLQFLVAAISYTLARVEFEVATRVNQLPICLAAVLRKPPLCNIWGDKNTHRFQPFAEYKASRTFGCKMSDTFPVPFLQLGGTGYARRPWRQAMLREPRFERLFADNNSLIHLFEIQQQQARSSASGEWRLSQRRFVLGVEILCVHR